MELKKRFLDEHGAQFELVYCPMLVPPLEWAAKGGLGSLLGSKQARADGMLRFTDQLIHKPLCRLEAATQVLAPPPHTPVHSAHCERHVRACAAVSAYPPRTHASATSAGQEAAGAAGQGCVGPIP